MEFWYRLRHYFRKFGYTFFGPAELDEEHDPLKIENREYSAHRTARRAVRGVTDISSLNWDSEDDARDPKA